MSAKVGGEDLAEDGIAGGVERHNLAVVDEMGVGVGLWFVPIELRHTESWREDFCINSPGEGGEAELFQPGINHLEGLGDRLFRRSLPSVAPALSTLVFGRRQAVVVPFFSSSPSCLVRVRLRCFLPEEQMIRRADLNEFPIFVDV